jgi:predicted amidophosphoribosyltransferase
MSLAQVMAATAQLFWPARCAGCDAPIPDAALFCRWCAPLVSPLASSCPGCALPSSTIGAGGDRCRSCRRAPFEFVEAQVACEYGAALADAIVTMKHGGRRDLAIRLARLLVDPLAQVLARGAFDRGDALIPVPLHPSKLRKRGFNQALELARAARLLLARRQSSLSGRAGRARALPRLERRLLRRVRDTRELGRLGPAARKVEVAGAFAVAGGARVGVCGRRVLLLDDVFTTGATLNECARVLRAAGAREVRVIALARAV